MRQIISFNNKNWQLPSPFTPSIQLNEIWYTSSDGNIVIPYSESSLPPIVSNTYINGKGIIKCDSDITYIRDYAFADCTSLTSITIPNSVTSIKERAFYDCTGLTSISYTGTIDQYNGIGKYPEWNTNVPATVVHCTDGDTPI